MEWGKEIFMKSSVLYDKLKKEEHFERTASYNFNK